MNQIPNWYVMAGGPSSGKTTLVGEMAKLGYVAYPEAVRIIIDREMARGRKLEEIQGTPELQKKVFKLQLENEENAPKDKIVFFDRALPEGIAYCRFYGMDVEEYAPPNWPKFKNRYRKIFFCQQLPFDKDQARIEDAKTANELSRLIRAAYVDLDYEIIDLAPTPNVSDRVKIVLAEIAFDKNQAGG